jgi:lipoprotein-anchoring transpeptidase ErfK/SrfK
MTNRSSWIEVLLHQQVLVLHHFESPSQIYPISTAASGIGERENSGCTPRGRHIIAQKIGEDAPINSVFVARQPTGEIYDAALAAAHPARDWILSRILWLAGCEAGFNQGEGCDTYRRYIYIHGTPDTEPMGIPLSHGCIRMRNTDVIDLFAQVSEGTQVQIVETLD